MATVTQDSLCHNHYILIYDHLSTHICEVVAIATAFPWLKEVILTSMDVCVCVFSSVWMCLFTTLEDQVAQIKANFLSLSFSLLSHLTK